MEEESWFTNAAAPQQSFGNPAPNFSAHISFLTAVETLVLN